MTHKTQIETLIKELRFFSQNGLHCEREIRDLLLYYVPRTTIERLIRITREIRGWLLDGTLTRKGAQARVTERLIVEAIRTLRETPNFTPPRVETTGYLQSIIVDLTEKKYQVEGHSRGDSRCRDDSRCRGDSRIAPTPQQPITDAFLVQNVLQRLDVRLKTLRGVYHTIDVAEIVVKLEKLQHQVKTGEILLHEIHEFLKALDGELMDCCRQQLGAEYDSLRQEVEGWFVQYRGKWNQDVMETTVEHGIRDRLWERYRVPRLY